MRVQADAGFVEDVDNAHEPHAELSREAHALGLAAGERVVVALEREVAEAGFEEEAQALLYAGDDLAEGVALAKGGDEGIGKRVRGADVEGEELGNGFPGDADAAAAGVEARAVALGAIAADHERGEARAEAVAIGVAPARLQVGEDAGERHGLGLAHAFQLKGEQPLPRPVEQRVAHGGGQVFPRGVGVEGELFGQLLELGVVLDDEIFSADAPRLDGAAAHGLLGVGDDELGDEAELAAETAAGAARALGVVEGEVARGEFFKRVAADLAGERLAEGELAPRSFGRFL